MENNDKNQLKEILSFIETTDLEFVHLEKNGKRITFRRSWEGIANGKNSHSFPSVPKEKEVEPVKLFSIRSPIVGRFFSSMAPDLPPLVVEGGRVTAGQKVAIVEAMKIKKEVFSALTGKVLRISVRDGDPVEYGQELFSVEPEKNG